MIHVLALWGVLLSDQQPDGYGFACVTRDGTSYVSPPMTRMRVERLTDAAWAGADLFHRVASEEWGDFYNLLPLDCRNAARNAAIIADDKADDAE